MTPDELVAATADVLRLGVPGWTVFEHGVPDGTLPGQYLVVYGSPGAEFASRACDTVGAAEPGVWVQCVSRNPNGAHAGREALAGFQAARGAVRGWRPEGRWPLRYVGGGPAYPQRDETLPETIFIQGGRFTLRTTP